MNWLPKLSLRNRSFIALVCVVITVVGILAMTTLRRELIPSISLPVVGITAVNPGASSEQMADNVADPIEREMRTLENVEGTNAVSYSNFSMITVELDYGTDIYRSASQADVLLNRVDSQLPDGTTTEVLTGGTGDIPAMMLSVSSDLSPAELSRQLDLAALADIGSVDGVATVQLLGAPDEIVSIDIDEEALAMAGLDRADIADALDEAGVVVPGGSVTDGTNELDISIGNEFTEVDDVAGIVLVPSDEQFSPTTLGEVATVELTTEEADSVSRTDGRDSITLLIMPATNANFIEVSEDVTQILNDATDTIGANTAFTSIFDQAPFIQESIGGLATEALWGLLFAVVIIFAFLLAVRPTIITGITIPLSFLFAFVGMLATGTTMNMMALAGLMISIGRMVDDSIVVIENIVRHLQHSTKSKARTIVDATGEVAGAVVSSTLVAMLVFLPLVLVSGIAGELFAPFAITVVLALSGSLIMALTIVPVLAYWFMGKKKTPKHSRTSASLPLPPGVDRAPGSEPAGSGATDVVEEEKARASTGWLARLYRPGLAWTISHRFITIIGAVVIFAGSLALYPLLKVNLLGDDGMNMVSVTQTLDPGTPLEDSTDAAIGAEEVLGEMDDVDTVQTAIGGMMMGTGAGSTNVINYTIITDPDADQVQVEEDIISTLDDYAASTDDAGEFELMQAGGIMGGSTVDVAIDALDDATRAEAGDILVDEFAALDEVSRVTSDYDELAPTLEITIREDDVAAMGMTVNEAVGLIASNTTELPVTSITIDDTELEVFMSAPAEVETVEDVEDLDLGGLLLSDIADVDIAEIPPSISTINAVRTITVAITPASADDVGAVTSEINSILDTVDLPDGVTAEIGGVSEDIDDAFEQLGLAMIAAILVIYVVMVWLFKSLIQPFILLMAIPFGATGMILALWITDTPLGAPALIGALMLIGIVVTNAIVLIDLINQYRRRGMDLDLAILLGGQNRVRPIIMTAAATIGAMIPPALGLSGQSSFVSAPMAIAVIGGLIASTLITLVIIPVLYRMIEGFKMRRAAKRGPVADEDIDDWEFQDVGMGVRV